MKSVVRAVLTMFALILLTGCTSSTQQEDPAAAVVIQHLEARTKSDADALRTLTCAAQEKVIGTMANSLEGLEATLKDVSCTFDGSSKVNCTGSIEVNYQGEIRSIPVKNYSVVQEDGQWKWCGEAE